MRCNFLTLIRVISQNDVINYKKEPQRNYPQLLFAPSVYYKTPLDWERRSSDHRQSNGTTMTSTKCRSLVLGRLTCPSYDLQIIGFIHIVDMEQEPDVLVVRGSTESGAVSNTNLIREVDLSVRRLSALLSYKNNWHLSTLYWSHENPALVVWLADLIP